MNLIINKQLWRNVVRPISDGNGSPFILDSTHLEYLKSQRSLAEMGCVGKREEAHVGSLHVSSQDSIEPKLIQRLINEILDHGSVMVMD